LAKSVTAPSKISDTVRPVSISPSRPSPSGIPSISGAPSISRSQGEVIGDTVFAHIAPLGWEHITFNGDYVWPIEPLQNAFRLLCNPRSAFLDPP
jgi:hypothetical protein